MAKWQKYVIMFGRPNNHTVSKIAPFVRVSKQTLKLFCAQWCIPRAVMKNGVKIVVGIRSKPRMIRNKCHALSTKIGYKTNRNCFSRLMKVYLHRFASEHYEGNCMQKDLEQRTLWEAIAHSSARRCTFIMGQQTPKVDRCWLESHSVAQRIPILPFLRMVSSAQVTKWVIQAEACGGCISTGSGSLMV